MGPPDDLWSECISVVSLELGEMRIRGTPIRLGLFGFSDGSFNLMDMNSRDFLVSTRQPNGFDGLCSCLCACVRRLCASRL